MLPARGRTHVSTSLHSAKKRSISSRFRARIAWLRASTGSRARSAMSARISLGALLQMDR